MQCRDVHFALEHNDFRITPPIELHNQTAARSPSVKQEFFDEMYKSHEASIFITSLSSARHGKVIDRRLACRRGASLVRRTSLWSVDEFALSTTPSVGT